MSKDCTATKCLRNEMPRQARPVPVSPPHGLGCAPLLACRLSRRGTHLGGALPSTTRCAGFLGICARLSFSAAIRSTAGASRRGFLHRRESPVENSGFFGSFRKKSLLLPKLPEARIATSEHSSGKESGRVPQQVSSARAAGPPLDVPARRQTGRGRDQHHRQFQGRGGTCYRSGELNCWSMASTPATCAPGGHGGKQEASKDRINQEGPSKYHAAIFHNVW
jgi:hypothetical protein